MLLKRRLLQLFRTDLVQRRCSDSVCVSPVVTTDLRAFQRLYDDLLATLPGVQRLSSTLVMKTVVGNRELPL